ncbi:MAG: DnaJ domain-containing protein [Deltaproteobacteria bacterium]|nr:DnaJ domain-containing protein [Deltaproteobacteria bacterium]
MLEGDVSDEDLGRVPRLAPDCDPTALQLSPAEGFLLSRIDGNTTWRMLREIGGMPPDEVDCLVEDWMAQSVIRIDGRVPSVARRKEAVQSAPSSRAAAKGEIDESLLDPDLDMDVEIQRKILVFEAGLENNYFQILGVERTADERDIKRAYFALSKEFHPDRYFRREIGGYGPRLNAVFKKVLEAYELLTDPASRAEIRKSLEEARASDSQSGGEASSASSGGRAAPRTPIERLRQRMPFKLPEKLRRERSEKGDQLFETASVAEERGDLADAAANLRLAIAFDSRNTEYKQAFGRVQARLAVQRIEETLKQREAGLDAGARKELSCLCDEALLYRGEDAETLHLVARGWLAIGDEDKAMKYAGQAADGSPESVDFLTTVAEIHLSRSEKGHAIKVLERALELDPGDLKARKLYELLKKKSRGGSSANGGVR